MAGLAEAAAFYGLLIIGAILVIVGGLLALAWWKRWPIAAGIACGLWLVTGLLLQPWSAFHPAEFADDPDEIYWLIRWRAASVIWAVILLAGIACWSIIVRRGNSAQLGLLDHWTRMEASKIEDGTWTLRVPHQRHGVWSVWLSRSDVLHPRFTRARFVLGDEQTILISADQVRAALREWLSDPAGRSLRPVKIDTERSTVDGFAVEIEPEV